MKRWEDVRLCSVCESEVVWEDEDARWLHVAAGADHLAEVAPEVVAAEQLIDVGIVLAQLTSGVSVDVVVDQVLAVATEAGAQRLCPGRCGWRWRSDVRRAVEEVADASRRERPIDPTLLRVRSTPNLGEPVWCGDDAALVLAAVGRLPELVAGVLLWADGHLDAGRSDSDGRSASGSAAPSPSPAHDLADAVIRWATDEAEQLVGVTTGGGAREATGAPLRATWLTSAVSTLQARASSWLSDLEHAEASGRAALRWERELKRATGQDLLVHRLPVRCPQCSTRTLTRQDGTEQVSCGRCGWSRTWDDYAGLVGAAAEEHRAEQRARRKAARCSEVS